jgi:hypothetical protein
LWFFVVVVFVGLVLVVVVVVGLLFVLLSVVEAGHGTLVFF